MCAWVSQTARRAQSRRPSSARNALDSSPGSTITASRVRGSATSQQFSANWPFGNATISISDTDFGLALGSGLPLREELFDGDGRRGGVTDSGRDLAGELHAEVAGGEEPRD